MTEGLVFVPENGIEDNEDLMTLVCRTRAKLEYYFCDNLNSNEFCELMKVARVVMHEEKTKTVESTYDPCWEIVSRVMYSLFQKELRDNNNNFFVIVEKMTETERMNFFDRLRYPNHNN